MPVASMPHLRLQVVILSLGIGQQEGRSPNNEKITKKLFRYISQRIRVAANPVGGSRKIEPLKRPLEFSPSDNVLASSELVRQAVKYAQARGATSFSFDGVSTFLGCISDRETVAFVSSAFEKKKNSSAECAEKRVGGFACDLSHHV